LRALRGANVGELKMLEVSQGETSGPAMTRSRTAQQRLRQASLAGEATDHFGPAFDLPQRALEQVGAAQSLAQSERVTEVSQRAGKVAREVQSSQQRRFRVEYDQTGRNIGRRYRRQDEIGTPFCITIDFDTLTDQAVTIRQRDSTEQERVKIEALPDRLKDLTG